MKTEQVTISYGTFQDMKKAFDSHADLVEALEYIKPHLQEYVEYHQKRGGCSIEMENCLEYAKQALAKARG